MSCSRNIAWTDLRMIYIKNSNWKSNFTIYISVDSPLKVGSKKTFLLSLGVLCSPNITYWISSWKSLLLITFDRAYFQHHSTYHSKALKKYFAKRYSFIVWKRFVFQLECLIIYPVFTKYYLNSFKYDI